jgi:sterol 24-C-methyltransferase
MSTPIADGRVQNRIENYTSFWQKDTSKEGDAENENRIDSYTDVVNGNVLHIPDNV